MYLKSDGKRSKHFFEDLDQNPGGGASTAGELILSLHGSMFELKTDRIVLPEELYISHGCVPRGEEIDLGSCRIKDFLKQLPTVQRLHLGNGWHLLDWYMRARGGGCDAKAKRYSHWRSGRPPCGISLALVYSLLMIMDHNVSLTGYQ